MDMASRKSKKFNGERPPIPFSNVPSQFNRRSRYPNVRHSHNFSHSNVNRTRPPHFNPHTGYDEAISKPVQPQNIHNAPILNRPNLPAPNFPSSHNIEQNVSDLPPHGNNFHITDFNSMPRQPFQHFPNMPLGQHQSAPPNPNLAPIPFVPPELQIAPQPQNAFLPQNAPPPQIAYPPQNANPPHNAPPLQNAFPPQNTFPPQHTFPPQNAFPPQNTFPSQNAPVPQNAFLPQNTYPPQNAPPPQNTFPPQNVFPPQNTFPPQNVFPLQNAPPPPSVFPPQNAFPPPQNNPPSQNAHPPQFNNTINNTFTPRAIFPNLFNSTNNNNPAAYQPSVQPNDAPSNSGLPSTFLPPDPSLPDDKPSSELPKSRPGQKKFIDEKDEAVFEFLSNFTSNKKLPKIKERMTVSEFRSKLKTAFYLVKSLSLIKENLAKSINTSDEEWKAHMMEMNKFKVELTEVSSTLSDPTTLSDIIKRLSVMAKKRKSKKQAKINKLHYKLTEEENRLVINQNIDKWLDGIKEKNDKLKREAEMKKEADFILAEVRKKNLEGKKTLEKLKVLEKLRSIRQENAVKKGLHTSTEHASNFETKIQELQTMMQKQLVDYEAEEHTLKVILETEQEGQLEAEAKWRIEKLKSLQENRKKNILDSLFGDTEEPSSDNPLHLFYHHHVMGNSSIDHLVQIRRQWDAHVDDTGESLPSQWVAPTAPSNSMWEIFCKK